MNAGERLEVQPVTINDEEAEWFAEMRWRAEEAAAMLPYGLMIPADVLGLDAKDTDIRVDPERLKRWRENTLPVKRFDGTTR